MKSKRQENTNETHWNALLCFGAKAGSFSDVTLKWEEKWRSFSICDYLILKIASKRGS